MPAQFPIIFGLAAVVLIAIHGAPICDSGWVALPHSQPLTGADVARALFPAHGTVKATGCSVAWSDTELAPRVPMQLEV